MASKMCHVVLVLTICTGIAVAVHSKGKDFAFAFLENDSEFWQNLPVEVHVINQENVDATVTMFAPRDERGFMSCTGEDRTVIIPAGTTYMYKACWYARISQSGPPVSRNALRIHSDVDVSVIGVNKETYTADSFLVLPISSLGTSYYTLSYGHARRPNQLAVLSTAANTAVSISIPPPNIGPSLSMNYDCMVYNDGSQFTLRLQQYEIYTVQMQADMTGVKIEASDPVAVFIGNVRIGVPYDNRRRDHLAEQLISVGNWDNQYVHIPIDGIRGDYLRVITAEDAVINYRNDTGVFQFSLVAGDWMQFEDMNNISFWWSDKKFSMMIITLSQESGSAATNPMDPASIIVPGINQFTNSYMIPAYINAFSTYNGGEPEPYAVNYLYVTILTDDIDGLRMDGGAVSFSRVCESVPGLSFHSACVLMHDGASAHTFTHDSASFGVYAYSASDRESVGSTLGISGARQCEPRLMRHGDGFDNDCDGESDEEICDSVDNDNDGLIDEDCTMSTGQAIGRTYVLTFTDNSKADAQPDDLDELELYISPQNTEGAMTTVKVTLPRMGYNQTVDAQPGMTTMIVIPSEYRLSDTGKFDLGILVEATEDIVVYALNKITVSSESYLAIPVVVTGYDYYAATYTVDDSADRAEFALCASELDTTEVEITLTDNNFVQVNYGNEQYLKGEVIIDTLEQYQCIQIQATDDLTGTRIRSMNNKRLSVFSGNRRPIIQRETARARDHIVEQLPPVNSWGREFFTNPIQRDGSAGNQRGDVVRVITSQQNTHITVTGTTGSLDGEYVVENAGGFQEFLVESNNFLMISTNNPAMVMLYSKTQATSDQSVDKGDASMALVVPKESWSNNYRFVTPLSGQTNDGGQTYLPYITRLSITIEKQHIDSLRYRTMDTAFSDEFPEAVWTDIPGSTPIVSVTTVLLSEDQYFLSAIDDNLFTATIYGAADREFYANPISLRLASDVCMQRIEAMTEGDGYDNDCDTRIDEEVCNGLDDDRDGLVDEDCAMPPDGVSENQEKYFVIFMDNIVEVERDEPLQIYASAKSPGKTLLRMRTTEKIFGHSCDIISSVDEGDYQQFGVSKYFRMTGSTIARRGIIIDATAPVDIAAFNMDTWSNDGMLALNMNELGNDYRVMSYWPPTLNTSLAVAAAESTTTVTVTLADPQGVAADQKPSINHPVTGAVVNSGESFTVQLNQSDVMQLISSGDLSGTRIQSDGPKLAVVSGNIRVGINSRSRDHLVEMIVPWAKSGNEWNYVTNGMSVGESLKFICDAGTTVTLSDPADTTASLALTFTSSDDVQQVEVSSDYSGRVTATDGTCQVYTITHSQSSSASLTFADPAMSVVLPVNHYIQRALFTIPRSSGGNDGSAYAVSLIIVARNGQLSGVRLNGNSVSGWTAIPGSAYSTVKLEVTPMESSSITAHVVESSSGTFEARLVGNADRESFAYPLGMNLA